MGISAARGRMGAYNAPDAAAPSRIGLVHRVRRAWDWLPSGRSLPLEMFVARHGWLTRLLWAHALALPLYGVARGYSIGHALLEGGVLALLAAAASVEIWPTRWREGFTALGLVTSSAVLVHFSSGLIEAHFHFFVIVLILGMYEDWIPFLISLGYVLLHHGVMGQFAPDLVYNHPDALANPWKWAVIHSGFVAAAAVGAVIAWRSNEVARKRAIEATEQAVQSHEANQLKSRFVATASHELRTPLTSIGGFATTLLHRWENTDEAAKLQMLGIIEAQSGRLRGLIEDLLVLSTIESGQVPVRAVAVNLGDAVRRIIKELDVDVELVDGPDCVAAVDEAHLARIVANLVENAFKHGAPPVTVRLVRTGRRVQLEVRDRGAGVPEDFRPRLFDSFTQAAPYRTDEGSGLGLSIVRGLAEANGGEATYAPNEPAGSRFTVRLPAA